MSKPICFESIYFGRQFSLVDMPGEGRGKRVLEITYPDRSKFYAVEARDADAALESLVDTLRVTHKLLEHLAQKLGLRISKPNEYHRDMVGFAQKIGESPEDVRVIADPIMRKLFNEMIAVPQKPKKKK